MADTDGEESCWTPAAAATSSHGGDGAQLSGVRREIYDRLRAAGNQEALSDPFFDRLLEDHFERLPSSYYVDLDVNKAEDVLLHRRILAECADPDNRPVFHARFLRYLQEDKPPEVEYDTCERMMEGLSLGPRKAVDEAISARRDTQIHLHEIIFCSNDKRTLLSQLCWLLSDLGLNIREARVFFTTDGLCLAIFVVDGWETAETDGLLQQLKDTAKRNPLLCNLTSSASERILELQEKIGDSEFDRDLLQIKEKIASGSFGDLYRGTYLDVDVAIKLLKTGHASNDSKVQFLQEIMILRSVNHENVIRFYGACTKRRNYLILTEYMAGGNLYDFLHKQNNTLELSLILRIAIGISKGMDYLHQNNIIHRDLKSANVLVGDGQVVKIADFSVARQRSQEGDMTAETGTYRWMAPEVINHKSYDHKADVFSFAIVLWELVTLKVPYESLTPLQAALSVRQGLRLVIPSSVHPRLSKLIQWCWGENPHTRPVFSEITAELEDILLTFQVASRSKGSH
ncbi:unnamed protein product [Triticum aestivum]|uniref:Protein kinase domain-containing protein n=1 Tax=Triticum aestivum TaxID=4565 RepID=A0A7H4LRA8_WHEAT|nr:serine/threonine-protein kinase STY8-like [Triticum aestivum]SPT21147.1 unnamed protein product [Triticum aestivum]